MVLVAVPNPPKPVVPAAVVVVVGAPKSGLFWLNANAIFQQEPQAEHDVLFARRRCYSKVAAVHCLNARLAEYLELTILTVHSLLTEEVGFRSGYSTVYHIIIYFKFHYKYSLKGSISLGCDCWRLVAKVGDTK